MNDQFQFYKPQFGLRLILFHMSLLMKMSRREQSQQGLKFKLESHVHNKIGFHGSSWSMPEIGEIHLQYKMWRLISNQLLHQGRT